MIKHSHQIIYWAVVFIFLNVFFGASWGVYLDSFYFTTMLLPVAMATSYFFNLFLVPRYLGKGKKLRFALYTVYTIIVSLFLSLAIAMFAFIVLSDLKWNEVNPVIGDVFQMGMVIYFITILFSFIRLYNSHLKQSVEITTLTEEQERSQIQTLTVRSNRKAVNILIQNIIYIESLSDYVKIHTSNDTVVTKEKISALEKTLPDQFIRIHRSFLIDKYKVESFGHDHVLIHSQKLLLVEPIRKMLWVRFVTSDLNLPAHEK